MISIRIIHKFPFQTADLDKWNLCPEPTNNMNEGISGRDVVLKKRLQKLQINNLGDLPFEIQYTAFNQPILIDGILGLDLLFAIGATIDLKNLELS